jgi:hypothetical protein
MDLQTGGDDENVVEPITAITLPLPQVLWLELHE